MSWSRWNAPSDYDYFDQYQTRGLERTCTDCGDPVMVDRDEVYQVQVFCEDCIARAVRRKANQHQARIDAIPAKEGAA